MGKHIVNNSLILVFLDYMEFMEFFRKVIKKLNRTLILSFVRFIDCLMTATLEEKITGEYHLVINFV